MIGIAPPPPPLSITPAQRIAELQRTVSASRLSCWLGCRLRFYFRHVARMTKPPTAAQHLGTVVHAVLHRWSLARWRGEPFTLETLKSWFDQRWAEQGGTIDWNGKEQEERGSSWNALQLYFGETPIGNDERPEAVEVRVEADLPGLPQLIGVIDLVRAGGVIVDFKNTGKSPSPNLALHQHEVQLSCYAVLYRDATGHQEGGFELHHLVRTKTPKVVVTAFPPSTESQQRRLRRQIESYVSGLERSDFVPSPGFHCAACEYLNECRLWN